jgi:hypothetical protein
MQHSVNCVELAAEVSGRLQHHQGRQMPRCKHQQGWHVASSGLMTIKTTCYSMDFTGAALLVRVFTFRVPLQAADIASRSDVQQDLARLQNVRMVGMRANLQLVTLHTATGECTYDWCAVLKSMEGIQRPRTPSFDRALACLLLFLLSHMQYFEECMAATPSHE